MSWTSWFTGTRDTKKPAREAIIRLRQNLQLLERKEQHLQTQIDEQQNKARQNAVSNPEGELSSDTSLSLVWPWLSKVINTT